jgi:hypothetical protein
MVELIRDKLGYPNWYQRKELEGDMLKLKFLGDFAGNPDKLVLVLNIVSIDIMDKELKFISKKILLENLTSFMFHKLMENISRF